MLVFVGLSACLSSKQSFSRQTQKLESNKNQQRFDERKNELWIQFSLNSLTSDCDTWKSMVLVEEVTIVLTTLITNGHVVSQQMEFFRQLWA